MSTYADLVCVRCNVRLWLGKTMHEDHRPIWFHRGGEGSPPHWARQELNAALWKMLAEHARHPLEVVVEGDPGYESGAEAREIGTDEDGGIALADYLEGWPGLMGRRPADREP